MIDVAVHGHGVGLSAGEQGLPVSFPEKSGDARPGIARLLGVDVGREGKAQFNGSGGKDQTADFAVLDVPDDLGLCHADPQRLVGRTEVHEPGDFRALPTDIQVGHEHERVGPLSGDQGGRTKDVLGNAVLRLGGEVRRPPEVGLEAEVNRH